ncbi:MAG TPA: response regulator [Candidatus Koribacter sp.]|jgi:DNA-binding response OmpR family regulator
MRTILYIDNSRRNLSAISNLLRQHGYRCLTAENYQEAERRFVANPVDLAIVDQAISEVNGAEVGLQLKSIRGVLVLLLTGSASLSDKPAGVDFLVPKPIETETLMRGIAHLLWNV